MSTPDAIIKGLQLFARGQTLHAAGQITQAAQHFQQALALMPNHPNILLAYGRLAEEVGDWTAAEKIYRKLGELRPDSNVESGLAAALFRQQRYADAIPYFETCLARKPDEPDLLHALCNCLCMVGRWEEGLAMARRAWAIREEAKYLDAMLNALFHLGRTDELDAIIDDAVARFPDSKEIRSIYALHKLKSGDYANGFRFFADLRWRNNLNGPRGEISAYAGDWDGKPFDGILVVTAEQGVGDEIMLSSMFDDFLACGQRLVIECDQRLLPLYQRAYPGLEFLPRHEKNALTVPADTAVISITALDAAHVFRATREQFPARTAWLRPDAAKKDHIRAAYQARWPGKKLVGLSWKSSRVMEGGGTKNIEMTDLLPLLATPDCVFINLQYGAVSDDLALAAAAGCEIFVDPEIDTMHDLDALAAQVAALDLVVSTSNTTVHIAGAVGTPCWLLLPKSRPILWYWGYRGERTPWYPSLQLLRNPNDENWTALIESTANRLAAMSSAPT